MSPDRDALAAASAAPEALLAPAGAASAGLLEITLPLWHRRWRLLLSTVVCGLVGLGMAMMQPVRFTGQASFIVQPLLRPSQSVMANAMPFLTGAMGAGSSLVDLHVSILRSQAIADKIIDRFDLMRAWGFNLRIQAQGQLAKRVAFGIGRRDGLVQVSVVDENPHRAAQMANEYIEELRNTLRGFALEDARQRRLFYDAQLTRARAALDQAQQKLQSSGYDRAALRSEPRAVADTYGRLQGEVAAAEVRLTGLRRVRAESSAEVQQLVTELAAMRRQLAGMEVPPDGGPGSFVSRVREFRYAETLAESIARQAEAARVDESADSQALQLLDRARTPEVPSSPQILQWLVYGAALGFTLQMLWILIRHRLALARLDPAFQQRVALIRSVLVRRR